MNILQKIKVLGEAANYDTVCGSPRSTNMGNQSLVDTISSFIYKSKSENYGCNILKVLQTNKCIHDCKYCINRCSGQKKLAQFEPEELARTFMHMRKKGRVNGLFLSSGIAGDADKTTEQMLKTARLLRFKYHFQGYIHFKVLPGTSKELIKQSAELSQRLSINIEAPSKQRLSEISSMKDFKSDILKRQLWIKKTSPSSGQTTQLVVGSSDETDLEILKTVDFELKEFNIARFYFSAFSPAKNTPLENKKPTPVLREHKLYNVEFMLRRYKFGLDDFKLILTHNDMLPNIDPKIALANRTLDRHVDINEAQYSELIKIPGIGLKTAEKILAVRKNRKIKKYEELHKLGIAVNRAKPYIKINGKYQKRLTEFK